MRVIRRRGWELPESRATPEHLFLDRRALLAALAASGLAPNIALAQRITDQPDPSIDL
jgi:methionine sulfoxide reductase catalytic subunit